MSLLTKSTTTNTVDNHYQLHILSGIQNTIDKKPLNDENFCWATEEHEQERWGNGVSGVRSMERRELKDIPPAELDSLLRHFFETVWKNDGSLYEPDTVSLFQCNIDQHLMQHRKPVSIIRDQQFASLRDALKVSKKHLKKEGKGNKPNAADALEPTDIDCCGNQEYLVTLTLSAHCGDW